MVNSSAVALALYVDGLAAHSPLSAAERALLLNLPVREARIPAHQDFVAAGQRVDSVSLVGDGLIGRFGQTDEGARQIVSLHLPGDMVDLTTVMSHSAPLALHALTATTLLRLPHEALRELCSRHPAIAVALLQSSLIEQRIVAQWLINIGRRDAHTRIAHFICEMVVRYGSKGLTGASGFPLPMTQEQLGDALGLTPIHINRTLKLLREEEVVHITRGSVRILDWAALKRAGEFDPGYLHLPAAIREAAARHASAEG